MLDGRPRFQNGSIRFETMVIVLGLALMEWAWWHLASLVIGVIAAAVSKTTRLRSPINWMAAFIMVICPAALMATWLPDFSVIHIGVPAALGAFDSLLSATFGFLTCLAWLSRSDRKSSPVPDPE